jgi:hypothetical protein
VRRTHFFFSYLMEMFEEEDIWLCRDQVCLVIVNIEC